MVGHGEAPIPLSGGGFDSPSKSAFNPYDTTSLHIFLHETFPGAILLEEHKVGILNELYNFKKRIVQLIFRQLLMCNFMIILVQIYHTCIALGIVAKM